MRRPSGETATEDKVASVYTYASAHEHKIQYTHPSAPPINTMCVSMPHTTISDNNTHVHLSCDRQHLVLLGLHVPYAHGVVQGAGDDEAAVT
jgi:hypothetical protein